MNLSQQTFLIQTQLDLELLEVSSQNSTSRRRLRGFSNSPTQKSKPKNVFFPLSTKFPMRRLSKHTEMFGNTHFSEEASCQPTT